MSKKLLLCGALAWASQAATVTLTTNPAALTFTYQIGAAKLPAVQTISVKASSGTPAFTATTPGTDAWITVDPSSGNLPATSERAGESYQPSGFHLYVRRDDHGDRTSGG